MTGNLLNNALKLKQKWRHGYELSVLGWQLTPTLEIAEIYSQWDYDAIIIDAEHSPLSAADIRDILAAYKAAATVPLVRVGKNDSLYIQQALDCGAGGVIVPRVESAGQAHAAVKACRYHPLGIRSFPPRRAGNYGHDMQIYLKRANDALLLMLQIETFRAYENFDKIIETEGVDAFFIGQGDLSCSMGHIGKPQHPEVQTIVSDIIRKCRKHNKPVCVACSCAKAEISRFFRQNVRIIACGGEFDHLRRGYQMLQNDLKSIRMEEPVCSV